MFAGFFFVAMVDSPTCAVQETKQTSLSRAFHQSLVPALDVPSHADRWRAPGELSVNEMRICDSEPELQPVSDS